MTHSPSIPPPNILELRSITKRFGSITANSDVSFSVSEGTIHGMVGENGAGKSTIMKIIYGLYEPDKGTLKVRGQEKTISSPQQARALGIGMVQQHFTLVPTLSAWENILLGSEPTLLKLPKQRIIRSIQQIQNEFGFSLSLETVVKHLPIGQQQQVEILKVLYQKAEILIFDEPTAVLTPGEVDIFFDRLKSLNAKGKTLILITHKLKEILSFTKEVTIMRQGKVIETVKTHTLTLNLLAEKIIGRKRISLPIRKTFINSKTVLRVKGLTGTLLRNLTFNIDQGQILGIAGIEGNGQQELCEILSTVKKDYSGEVCFLGHPLSQLDTYTSKQRGLAVIPPDRHVEGVILDFTVEENAILGHHREPNITRGFRFSNQKRSAFVTKLLNTFDIRPPDPSLSLRALSGGNQQKLVVGRETVRTPQFLLAAHPTRGVDLGAVDFIHSHFLKLREEGAALLLISSELEEILTLADKILVLYKGHITGEVTAEKATESQLGKWMTGGAI